MLPSGTRRFHNLLKIWTNLTQPPRPCQSLRGSWLQGGRMTGRHFPEPLATTEAPQMVRCEVWTWGGWLACHTHPQSAGCCEPRLQLRCFLPGFGVRLPLPTSCSLNLRLGGPGSQRGKGGSILTGVKKGQNPLAQASPLHPQQQQMKQLPALLLPERTVFKQGALASCHGARAAAAAIIVILGVAREALASS